ncbi:TetR/AcrR family transcriptional regulator [Microbacterium sp. HD4P20]|uniref:TetR/AcrR family transcriptional regulator n=1 Tax=Microbacterium sp. HD4P20 TaxID=2864874 RepID=UPI001C642669|nr:TetR/AcrR family transcriptional regulator [Microbacterium sp. HD4P20]MCP2638397.1 TetR/AcrR family transcriptional regulator [Microbacterium sp. HD4P20]
MGQREQLLEGARVCLIERGFAHTTARDIVAASPGANLASIGYHFGSKDALMNAAVIQLIEGWGDRIAEAADGVAVGTPADRLEQFLSAILAADAEDRRVAAASVQAFAQAEFSAEVRDQYRSTYERARVDLTGIVLGISRDRVAASDAATLGSVCLALLNGAVLQWLIDPAASAGFEHLTVTLAALGRRTSPAGDLQ